MESRNALTSAVAAQPGIAADRFAREIVEFWDTPRGALAAAECQPVGPLLYQLRTTHSLDTI